MIPLEYFVVLSVLLFSIGLLGIFLQRNAIRILISVELMLNAANINFVAFNSYLATNTYDGWSFSIIIIALAAAEVAIGLAILISLFRSFHEIDLGNIFTLRESMEEN